jgi:GTP cyclohydrolase I
MRGGDVVEDEDEETSAVVVAVVVEDDGGGKGVATTTTTTTTAMGEASAASTSDEDETVVGARLERCVREMLRAMGEDVTREGLLDTPARVAKALTFAMRGYGASATAALGTALFHEDGLVRALRAEEVESGTHDMVVVRDIPVFSTCAKTFMPFYGVIHVGYVPHGGVIVGLSKLARVAEVYARRLQTPDGLAHAVAHALHDVASPLGVGVMFTGVHLGPFGTRETAGRASTGCFASANSVWWEEFSALVEHGGGPSELSRGLWGDDARCTPCDDDENAIPRGPAETFVDAAAMDAAECESVDESVRESVMNLFRELDVEKSVRDATNEEASAEDTARQFSRLLSAMRSGSDVPFGPIEAAAARDLSRRVDADADARGDDGVVVVRNLRMSTVCEHHLLPFHGTVSVAYITNPTAGALSHDTLQALVSRHSRRLQVQERLTRDVAEEISALTGGIGVMVAARAAHLCMVSRGVEKPGSSTCTVTKLGRLASEPALRSRVWGRMK